MNTWTHIIIHHSLTEDGQTVNWQAIRRYHIVDLGWADIGYHYGIEWIHRGYEILVGRPLSMDGAHTLGMNDKAIGICVVGNYDVQYPMAAMIVKLVPLVRPFLAARKYPDKPADYLAKAILTLQPRTHTLVEMADAMKFYLVSEITCDPAAAKKHLTSAMIEPFTKLIQSLEKLEGFDEAALEHAFQEVAAAFSLKLGKIAQPVRVALTGQTVSPGIFEIVNVLGKETVLERLRRGLDYMRGH